MSKMPDGDQKSNFKRVQADIGTGLSSAQVQARVAAGADNAVVSESTLTVGKIIRKNIFTLFNAINLGLAVAVFLVGSPKNALFFFVAVANTLMGIFQELRAKHTLDKLSILARGKATVVRDGKQVQIEQENVVIDDILILNSGNQVVADAEVVATDALDVDESLLTGESNAVHKKTGDKIMSGSFVSAGQAYVRITAVGRDSYAGKLATQAKKTKKATAPLMNTLNTIIKVLAVVIIPIGALLFYQQYTGSDDLQASVLGSTAAMVGMIPEGLILLTGVTLLMGALKLARRKALVQSLPSIETLARVDVLCLDKTGTITDGTLSFENIVPKNSFSEEKIAKILSEMMNALKDENATAKVIRENFQEKTDWQVTKLAPFDSVKKWSGVDFEKHGSYILGAPSFVITKQNDDLIAEVAKYTSKGQRVLCLAHSEKSIPEDTLPEKLKLIALIVLSDHIRPEAKKTFQFFKREGVALKVISGDDAQTVSVIAERVGIEGAENYIDLGAVSAADLDYGELTQKYTVFGRVKPEQKKALIAAMKADHHTVCMTGDGVNDVLALKEADCGVAMISGSDAARASADFVLMTGDFSAMVDVLKEGRRVINNIENVASLYLVKTIYSTILSLSYAVIPYPYPFTPLQMTPINTLTVGIPSFFLAFRNLYSRPRGRFLVNVLENAVPAAVTVVLSILIIQVFGIWLNLSQIETGTMNVILTATIGFCLLYKVSKPLKTAVKILIGVVGAVFLFCLIGMRDFFGYASLLRWSMLLCVPLLFAAPWAFNFASGKIAKFIAWYLRRRKRKSY